MIIEGESKLIQKERDQNNLEQATKLAHKN